MELKTDIDDRKDLAFGEDYDSIDEPGEAPDDAIAYLGQLDRISLGLCCTPRLMVRNATVRNGR